MPPRLSGLKVFWPGVEICIRIGLVLVMIMVVVLPVAWGYRQHAEAELWREVACGYRLKEAVRERLVSAADVGGRPCARVDELGLRVEPPVAFPASAAASRHGVWPSASVSE
jgi:hypothetical protein